MRTITQWIPIFFSRRYARICVAGVFVFAFLLFFIPVNPAQVFSVSSPDPSYPPYPTPLDSHPLFSTLPPTYGRYVEYEDNLPQNNESLPYPEGKHAKYLYIAGHNYNAGWGNAMQDLLLNAYLAYASGRSSVIYNYTWSRDAPDISLFNGKTQIPSRIPMSALLSGPLAGQPFSDPAVAAEHPRFVSHHYYNQVCPNPVILDGTEIHNSIPSPGELSALKTLEFWVKKLESIEERCVEVGLYTLTVFTVSLFGTSGMHDIVPDLIASPLLQEFSWSPLINHAFQVNEHHFTTASSKTSLTKRSSFTTLTPTDPYPSTLPILALHVRRGDFIDHCQNLYSWGLLYTGFNTLPELPDRLVLENPSVWDAMSDEERRSIFISKCYVDADIVRKRIVRAVTEWREKELDIERKKKRFGAEGRVKQKLRKVYIMTNGDREWLQELKGLVAGDAARSAQTKKNDNHNSSEFDYDFVWDWDEIATSRDLELGWEAKYVSQALDMYVGQRAEVFVGNGFSSLTANVVLLRKANGVESWKTRFW